MLGHMYTTQPKLPPEIAELYETILRTLHGTMTPTEAAEKLEALLPKKPGRKSMPQRERKLQEENERLKRENRRLEERVETIDRLMTVAGGILRGQVRTVRRKKKKVDEGSSNEAEDPDGAARRKVAEADRLREAGMTAAMAAALVGASAATTRRWRARVRHNQVACQKRGPGPGKELSAQKREDVVELVRDLRGLCGAAALARSAGVSRRQAAQIKSEVMTELERERVARCSRLLLPEPGVLRS